MSNSNVKTESVPYRNDTSGGCFQICWLLSEADLVGPGDLKQAPIDISLGCLSSDTLATQAPKFVCLLTDHPPLNCLVMHVEFWNRHDGVSAIEGGLETLAGTGVICGDEVSV